MGLKKLKKELKVLREEKAKHVKLNDEKMLPLLSSNIKIIKRDIKKIKKKKHLAHVAKYHKKAKWVDSCGWTL